MIKGFPLAGIACLSLRDSIQAKIQQQMKNVRYRQDGIQQAAFYFAGISRYMERLWYRRKFEVPAAWAGNRVILHFGAVDWQCQVYVNGKEVGTHTGGYDKVDVVFSFSLLSSSLLCY